MVVIFAWWINVFWRSRFLFPGSSSRSFPSAVSTRSRISAAAAFVKVMTSSLSISTGCSGSVIMRMIRSTRTAVFPLPAAAETRRFRCLVSMTFFCSSVHFVAITESPFRHFLFQAISFSRFLCPLKFSSSFYQDRPYLQHLPLHRSPSLPHLLPGRSPSRSPPSS